MKILWIPHVSWRRPQRARIFCEKLSEKHEIHVTDIDANFTTLQDFISSRYLKNYFYRRWNDGRITLHHIPRISPALFSKTLRNINYSIYSRYIQKIIKQYDIDVVVSAGTSKPPRCKKLIFDLFDDNPAGWREFGIVKSYADEIEAIENEYFKKADAIVAVSSVLADKARMLGGENVHIIPNAIKVDKYRNASGEKIRKKLKLTGKVIGFIGNHGKFSGLLHLVEAAKSFKDLTFLIAGAGTEIPEAKKLVKKYNLNFIFTGHINPGDIHEYYKAIDIGLLPSIKSKFRDSACPVKLLEYTAAGKPVVSTDLEEVKRMDFSNVILVKDNPESLAEGIEKVIDSDFKFKIPKKIEEYDIKRLAKRYEDVLIT